MYVIKFEKLTKNCDTCKCIKNIFTLYFKQFTVFDTTLSSLSYLMEYSIE